MKSKILAILAFSFLHFTTILCAYSTTELNPVFTSEESAYLKEKKQITMCIDPNWMPFENIENGKHVGMSSDFMKLFEKQIGIPIVLVPVKTWTESIELAKQRKCDILSLVMETKERREYLKFTRPYISASILN